MAKKELTKTAPKAKSAPKAKAAVPPKPAQEAWITPYLTVKSPETAIAFYKKAFGFEELFSFKHEGKIMHAEIGYRGQKFMLGPESSECSTKAPSNSKGTTFSLYTFVDDVDQFIANAKKNGAKVTSEPKDQFYGDRTASVTDPEGHLWVFATHKFDWNPSQTPKADSCCGQ